MATVGDFVQSARGLVQDTNPAAYRFADAVFVEALNLGLIEMRRLRFDLFIGITAQNFIVVDSTTVIVEETYRNALINFMAGRVMLRDHDDADTQRAANLIKLFHMQLTSLGA